MARPRRQLSPRSRKIALTVHVATSVGWLGSAYTMLVLGVAGALSVDAAFRLGCYEVMHLFDRAVNIPLGFTMLASGLVSSLWTRWGLVRHRWVLTKFLISLGVLVVTPILSVPRVLMMIERLHAGTDPGSLPVEIIAVSVATVLTLTAVTAIPIFKPWGRTRWARRPPAHAQVPVDAVARLNRWAQSRTWSSSSRGESTSKSAPTAPNAIAGQSSESEVIRSRHRRSSMSSTVHHRPIRSRTAAAGA